MSAYILAGIAAFLWSIVNVVDKALIERFCKNGDTGALLILSSLFPVTLLPVAYYFAEGSLILPVSDILILILTGVLMVGWIAVYLNTLVDEDVSIVAPLMQLTPVFAFVLAFLILGELPSNTKLLAGLVIIIGSIVLSFEHTTGKLKITLLFSMLSVSAIIALINVLFKFVTVEESFWLSMFWHALGIVVTGFILYIFHSSYRQQFHRFTKDNWGIGIGLNGANETLTIAGDILFAYAILLAPLALVQTMEAYQPLFVFIINKFGSSTVVMINSDKIKVIKLPLLKIIIINN